MKNDDSHYNLFDVLLEEFLGMHPECNSSKGNDDNDNESNDKKNNKIPSNLKELYSRIHKLPNKRSALCLSGGGIRSATFCLGVIQGLAEKGLLSEFHYLFTVSGGGYIGSWLTAWLHRYGKSIPTEEADESIPTDESGESIPTDESDKSIPPGKSDTTNSEAYKQARCLNQKALERISCCLICGKESPVPSDCKDGCRKDCEEGKEKSNSKDGNPSEGKEARKSGGCSLEVEGNNTSRKGNGCSSKVEDGFVEPYAEPQQVRFLRDYSNYLSPRVGLLTADTWTLIATYIRNLLRCMFAEQPPTGRRNRKRPRIGRPGEGRRERSRRRMNRQGRP